MIYNALDLARAGIVRDMSALRPVLSVNADPLVDNATLRYDEWKHIDDRVNAVLRDRLTVTQDLRAAGLVEPVPLGAILRITERLSQMGDAEIIFHGDTDPKKDKATFSTDTIPVPIISKGFDIDWRQLDASRMHGTPLDTTYAEQAARRVADKLESLITNGLASGGPTGGGIPGLTSATNVLTASLGTAWDAASGATPIADVKNMLATAYASNLFGPFTLYVPKNYWSAVQDDYSSSKGDRTYAERILAFDDIKAVRPNDKLADDTVVLVQMTRDVLDLSEAQAITTIQWQKTPLVTHFLVLAVAGPQVKSMETGAGSTVNGIVVLS